MDEFLFFLLLLLEYKIKICLFQLRSIVYYVLYTTEFDKRDTKIKVGFFCLRSVEKYPTCTLYTTYTNIHNIRNNNSLLSTDMCLYVCRRPTYIRCMTLLKI